MHRRGRRGREKNNDLDAKCTSYSRMKNGGAAKQHRAIIYKRAWGRPLFSTHPPDRRSRVARDEIKIFRASVPCARGRKRGAGAGIRVTKHEKSSYFTIYLVPGEEGLKWYTPTERCHEFVSFYAQTLQGCAAVFCRNFTVGEPKRRSASAAKSKHYRLSSSISPF